MNHFKYFGMRLIRDGVAEFLSSGKKIGPNITAKVNFESTYAGMKTVLNSNEFRRRF